MLELTAPYENVASQDVVRVARRLIDALRGEFPRTSLLLQQEATHRASWYFVEPWSSMEREVDEYVRRGDVSVYESIDEFLASLDD